MSPNRAVPPVRPSMQQLNPLGSAGSWELAVVLGLATGSYALFSTLAGRATVTDPNQMVLALVLMTLAVVLNMVASAPRSGRYGGYDYLLIVGLGLSAALLQGSASVGGVASITTDWGPLALAGILAAASSFRPQVDQFWAGCVSTALIAVQKTFEGLNTPPPFGLTYFVVTAVAPIVIVTIGQAAYTGYAIRALHSWRQGLEQTQDDVRSLLGMGAARKIGQEFLAEFSVEVQPLLARILSAGRISEADSAMAAVAAERIRIRLVTLAEQTWLERLPTKVLDPDRVVEKFDVSARAAIAALLNGLERNGVTGVVMLLASSAGGGKLQVKVSGFHEQSRFSLRTQLAPILRVLFVVFSRVKVVYETTSVTLQFDYGVE